jgi:hypothetical protein
MRAGDIVQVVEHLPSNLKVLSSNPRAAEGEGRGGALRRRSKRRRRRRRREEGGGTEGGGEGGRGGEELRPH